MLSQIYFLLRGGDHFDFEQGSGDEYRIFFDDRVAEINALGPKADEQLHLHLREAVFGIKEKEPTAEQRKQKEFSTAQLQAIRAQAAREEAEEGAEEEADNGAGGNN